MVAETVATIPIAAREVDATPVNGAGYEKVVPCDVNQGTLVASKSTNTTGLLAGKLDAVASCTAPVAATSTPDDADNKSLS